MFTSDLNGLNMYPQKIPSKCDLYIWALSIKKKVNSHTYTTNERQKNQYEESLWMRPVGGENVGYWSL